MKSKILLTTAAILIVFLSVLVFNYLKSRHLFADTNKNSQSVQSFTGEEISRLGNGVIVRFPATLVKQPRSDCIELFAQDDFRKYKGDGKFAIYSRFPSESRLADRFGGRNNNVMVTGKMIFVTDSTDASKNCGVITGQIFEITEVEYF